MELAIDRFVSLINNLRPGVRRRRPQAAALPARPVQLPSYLLFISRRLGTHQEFHLMAHSLSTESILFKTTAELEEGEMLELQALMLGEGPMQFLGRVEWVLGSGRGQTGQIRIFPTPEQTRAIGRYLSLLLDNKRP